MAKSTAATIAENNRRRHNHYDESAIDRCDNCGSFVSLPEADNNQIRYYCKGCDRCWLKYVRPQKATSD